MLSSLYRGTVGYLGHVGQFNRNVRLCLAASVLSAMAQGIFGVAFNLYILSMGITADVLGGILSASPLAQGIGSIPAGLVAEVIGFRHAFGLIYATAGLSQVVQVTALAVPVIVLASFVGGLGMAGDFVVRLPFLAAQTSPAQRNHVFSVSSMLNTLGMALGALFAGFAPTLLGAVTTDLTTAYRWTLYSSAALLLVAALPSFLIRDATRTPRRHLGLGVYLWGMDRFTFQQAVVSLFVGLSMGLVFPFLNLFFVYHLDTSREFFGTVTALAIVPLVLATALAPTLAVRLGSVRVVTILRCIIPLCMVLMAVTRNPLLGTLGYWGQRALISMSQPLSFAFAMDAAAPRAKLAASAWLNVTFWLGNALAAPIAGALIGQSNYALPLYLAAAAMLGAAVCNEVFFGPLERAINARAAQ